MGDAVGERVQQLEQELEEERRVRRIYERRMELDVGRRVEDAVTQELALHEEQWNARDKELVTRISTLQDLLRQQEESFLAEREALMARHNQLTLSQQEEWRRQVTQREDELKKSRKFYSEEMEGLKKGHETERDTWSQALRLREEQLKAKDPELEDQKAFFQEALERRERNAQELIAQLSTEIQDKEAALNEQQKALAASLGGLERRHEDELGRLREQLAAARMRRQADLAQLHAAHHVELEERRSVDQALQQQLQTLDERLVGQTDEWQRQLHEQAQTLRQATQEERVQWQQVIVEKDRAVVRLTEQMKNQATTAVQERLAAGRALRQANAKLNQVVNRLEERERMLAAARTEGTVKSQQVEKVQSQVAQLKEERQRLTAHLAEVEHHRQHRTDTRQEDWIAREAEWQQLLEEKDRTLEAVRHASADESRQSQERVEAERRTWRQTVKGLEHETQRLEEALHRQLEQERKGWVKREAEVQQALAAFAQELRGKESALARQAEDAMARYGEAQSQWQQERRQVVAQWQELVTVERHTAEELEAQAVRTHQEVAALTQELEALKVGRHREASEHARGEVQFHVERTALQQVLRDQETRLGDMQRVLDAQEDELKNLRGQALQVTLLQRQHATQQEDVLQGELKRARETLIEQEHLLLGRLEEMHRWHEVEVERRVQGWQEERQAWNVQREALRAEIGRLERRAADQGEAVQGQLASFQRRLAEQEHEWQHRFEHEEAGFKEEMGRQAVHHEAERATLQQSFGVALERSSRKEQEWQKAKQQWQERWTIEAGRVREAQAHLAQREQEWQERAEAFAREVSTLRSQHEELRGEAQAAGWKLKEMDQERRALQERFQRMMVEWQDHVEGLRAQLDQRGRESLSQAEEREREHTLERSAVLEDFKKREHDLLLARVEVQEQLSKVREEWKKREQQLREHIDELNTGIREMQKQHFEELTVMEGQAREQLSTRERAWQKNLKEQYVSMKMMMGEMTREADHLRHEVERLSAGLREGDRQARTRERALEQQLEAAQHDAQMNVDEHEALLKNQHMLQQRFQDLQDRKRREVEEEQEHVLVIELGFRQARDRFLQTEKALRLELARVVQSYEERLQEQEPQYRALLERKELQVVRLTNQSQDLHHRFEEAQEERLKVVAHYLTQLEEAKQAAWRDTEAIRVELTQRLAAVRLEADEREARYRQEAQALRESYEPMLWELKRLLYMTQAKFEARAEEVGVLKKEEASKREAASQEARKEIAKLRYELHEQAQHDRALLEEAAAKEQQWRALAASRDEEILQVQEMWRSRLQALERKHMREIESWAELIRMKEETSLVPWREPSLFSGVSRGLTP